MKSDVFNSEVRESLGIGVSAASVTSQALQKWAGPDVTSQVNDYTVPSNVPSANLV